MDRLDQRRRRSEDCALAIQGSDTMAKSLAINGTPSYVVGDDVLVGAVGFDDINKQDRKRPQMRQGDLLLLRPPRSRVIR